MGRPSRVELQERNRAKVLTAARDEFAEHGFRDAKVDRIAGRAGLTRGAVYSNFPSKRALYFSVLAALAERTPGPPHPEPGHTAPEALGTLARAWVARLPLADTDEPHGPARLGMYVMPEILAEERIRRPFAQLMKLDALLLGLALEGLRPPGAPDGSLVRVAEAVLTTLHGAGQMAAAAPGFVEPFNVVSACAQLAGLDLNGWWPPPHVITQAWPTDEPWSPPPTLDAVHGGPARLTDDGVVAILGLHRLEAVEEAVRAAPPGATVTAVLVTGDPDELAPLARLAVADLCGCLRQAFPPSAWPRLQVVFDESGALAAAAGVPAVSDGTEVAVRIRASRITARADGRGACHATASAPDPRPPSAQTKEDAE
ncbi:TetR/AcrR family transcriptional regulator [Streptomyces sp. SID13666]|uniref:TetR/AcrR family transcriptional regulator n=1 Tax=unclassified Streptomyces TaxID=2593676 RepID=UPI0013C09A63|nr:MULTISPECIES: TetR/AcrR family transcriptional regulator [unclassified Streptomyces]NEA52641.1 TetR/AcrR family transcriptional regulator [Streptomyces sp. SID13666]NEA70032.1 TetR/AcrR family transcriptional regulator [Streptomyces sp. SID13588]